jgi:hypothetical protein
MNNSNERGRSPFVLVTVGYRRVAVFLRSQHEKHSKAVTSRSKQVDLQYLWKNVSLGRNRDTAVLQRTLQDDRLGAVD